MQAIPELTPLELQTKTVSKEIVIDTLMKKTDKLTEELNELFKQIEQSITELNALNELFEKSSSSQDTVTDKNILPLPPHKPAQPESSEDQE